MCALTEIEEIEPVVVPGPRAQLMRRRRHRVTAPDDDHAARECAAVSKARRRDVSHGVQPRDGEVTDRDGIHIVFGAVVQAAKEVQARSCCTGSREGEVGAREHGGVACAATADEAAAVPGVFGLGVVLRLRRTGRFGTELYMGPAFGLRGRTRLDFEFWKRWRLLRKLRLELELGEEVQEGFAVLWRWRGSVDEQDLVVLRDLAIYEGPAEVSDKAVNY